jgi:hypothetical protein
MKNLLSRMRMLDGFNDNRNGVPRPGRAVKGDTPLIAVIASTDEGRLSVSLITSSRIFRWSSVAVRPMSRGR